MQSCTCLVCIIISLPILIQVGRQGGRRGGGGKERGGGGKGRGREVTMSNVGSTAKPSHIAIFFSKSISHFKG